MTRRDILKLLSTLGIGSAVFGRAVEALAQDAAEVTPDMIKQAEWVAGLSLSDEKRQLMVNGMNESIIQYEAMREVYLDNSVPPALIFQAASPSVPGSTRISQEAGDGARPTETVAPVRPGPDEDLAFLPVTELSALIRTGRVSSVELTELYLERLERYDKVLECVITRTEEFALRQAERVDREIASGRYRGPLHGIPWGAKDIISVPSYPTTWGATPYKGQVRKETATVATRLQAAGAVLVAKLTVGALAWGDVWFDGMTRNPWNTELGSSGSSAGSASATSAGLIGFALGSETWGSIVSPCTVCGVSGLRPTFGRISRFGVMALSWSMDKIGPIARSVEDTALVLDAIRGTDGRDATVVNSPFRWPMERDPRSLRVGYVPELFEIDRTKDIDPESEDADATRQAAEDWARNDLRTLDTLRHMGFTLQPVTLPSTYPVDALGTILTAEAATAFDELTRSGRDDELVRQVEHAWPNVFRQGQLIPAVEYLRANRIRTLVMREMEAATRDVDVWVAPSWLGNHLLLTNLTGHPAVVVPNGFVSTDGTPTSITFTGRLFEESEVLAVAHAYQEETGYHLERPPIG